MFFPRNSGAETPKNTTEVSLRQNLAHRAICRRGRDVSDVVGKPVRFLMQLVSVSLENDLKRPCSGRAGSLPHVGPPGGGRGRAAGLRAEATERCWT